MHEMIAEALQECGWTPGVAEPGRVKWTRGDGLWLSTSAAVAQQLARESSADDHGGDSAPLLVSDSASPSGAKATHVR